MINDLRKKTVDELKKIEEESRAELFALRFQSSVGNLEKPHRINELKKTVARVLTVINEKLALGETITVKNLKVDLSKAMEKAEQATKTFKKEQIEEQLNAISEQQSENSESATSNVETDKPLKTVKKTEAKPIQTSSSSSLEQQTKKDNKEKAEQETVKTTVETEADKTVVKKEAVKKAEEAKSIKSEQETKVKTSPTTSKTEAKTIAKPKVTKTIVEETKTKSTASNSEKPDVKKASSKPIAKEATSSSNKKATATASKKDDEPFEEDKIISKNIKTKSDKKDVKIEKDKPVISELIEQQITSQQSAKAIHEKVINKITEENKPKVKVKVEKIEKPEQPKEVIELRSITDAKATFDAKEIEKIAKGNMKAKQKAEETALDHLERIKNKTSQSLSPADGKGTLEDIKLNVKAKPKNTKAYTYGKQWHENSENIKEISQKHIKKALGKKKEVK